MANAEHRIASAGGSPRGCQASRWSATRRKTGNAYRTPINVFKRAAIRTYSGSERPDPLQSGRPSSRHVIHGTPRPESAQETAVVVLEAGTGAAWLRGPREARRRTGPRLRPADRRYSETVDADGLLMVVGARFRGLLIRLQTQAAVAASRREWRHSRPGGVRRGWRAVM